MTEGEKEGPQELSSPQAVEKLRVAAEIANAALKQLLCRVVPGADVFELCLFGDNYIDGETKKVYQKKTKSKSKIEKGIAVPTSISVNEVFANCSPCERGASFLLKKGDVVKVDLGVHVDGFVAAVGYTVICCSSNAAAFGSNSNSGGGPAAAAAAAEAAAAATATTTEILAALPPPSEEYLQQQQQLQDAGKEALAAVDGAAALVTKACWLAAEAAIRKIEIGSNASEVTKAVDAVAEDLGVKPMQGVLCYQMKQHVIEGSRCFPLVAAAGEEKVRP
ncbi:proliferation-associated protein 2g4, putative [Eimeria acervulina]|uniref:Proliferation-associated protein 2g4, putative n=1 Tax=Eimeria acervulina TaxID=5801 RepID=U6JMK3_EIMAC|nr:proliferation-associated protein 2g4, putative [Eimeria acervulina]CDJ26769.1 proliferation-associated protein 2g4, putative [Eimeria acervulina]